MGDIRKSIKQNKNLHSKNRWILWGLTLGKSSRSQCIHRGVLIVSSIVYELDLRFQSQNFNRISVSQPYIRFQVKSVKDEMGEIRKNINHIKDLHSKIITEVSQQKSKGVPSPKSCQKIFPPQNPVRRFSLPKPLHLSVMNPDVKKSHVPKPRQILYLCANL